MADPAIERSDQWSQSADQTPQKLVQGTEIAWQATELSDQDAETVDPATERSVQRTEKPHQMGLILVQGSRASSVLSQRVVSALCADLFEPQARR